jgi:hypothetical protein
MPKTSPQCRARAEPQRPLVIVDLTQLSGRKALSPKLEPSVAHRPASVGRCDERERMVGWSDRPIDS